MADWLIESRVVSTVLHAAWEVNYSFTAEDSRPVLLPGSLLFSERGCVCGDHRSALGGSGYGFLGHLRMLSAFSARRGGGRPLPSQFPPPLRSRKPHYYCESQPRTPLASALSLPVRRAVSVSSLEHRRRGAGDSVRRRSFSQLSSLLLALFVALWRRPLPPPPVREGGEGAGRAFPLCERLKRELEQCHLLCALFVKGRVGQGVRVREERATETHAQEGKVLSRGGALWLVWGSPPVLGTFLRVFERTRRAALGTSIHFTGLSTLAPPRFICLFTIHSFIFP